MVRFHEREFDLYAILAGLDAPEAWRWPAWQELAVTLTPLVRLASDRPAIRTTQYENKKSLSFGRLTWKPSSAQKWTHDSPLTRDRSAAWIFLHAEMWAPSWSVSEREGRAPDVFFAMLNEKALGDAAAHQFSQRIVLAVAADLGEIATSLARAAALELATLLHAAMVVYQRRPWGHGLVGGTGFKDAIQDLPLLGLFKPGNPHTRHSI